MVPAKLPSLWIVICIRTCTCLGIMNLTFISDHWSCHSSSFFLVSITITTNVGLIAARQCTPLHHSAAHLHASPDGGASTVDPPLQTGSMQELRGGVEQLSLALQKADRDWTDLLDCTLTMLSTLTYRAVFLHAYRRPDYTEQRPGVR